MGDGQLRRSERWEVVVNFAVQVLAGAGRRLPAMKKFWRVALPRREDGGAGG
jgi:hypothetical protein